MAGEFLRSHGIDVDAEMARIQFGDDTEPTDSSNQNGDKNRLDSIINASLPKTKEGTTWDLYFSDGKIKSIRPHRASNQTTTTFPPPRTLNAHSALCAPSLCHPHIHLDKAYLLSHPSHSHLQVQTGDFNEAMTLTNTAKSNFTRPDLLSRGQRLIDESIASGVTHIRAFVEIDALVRTRSLEAALELQTHNTPNCILQLSAFAQLPLFSRSPNGIDEAGATIRSLMTSAASNPAIACLASTPYVESTRARAEENITWLLELSSQHRKHVDFHLDYNLHPEQEPLIHFLISKLISTAWAARNPGRTVVLGHCTRLTLFSQTEWQNLADTINKYKLPVHFVGLPTSDLYMSASHPRAPRATLPVLSMIKDYGLNAALGVNNLGNAFTPFGSADPVLLAGWGVGIFGAGTKEGAGRLLECVSTRGREGIGLGRGSGGEDAGGEDGEDDGSGCSGGGSGSSRKGRAYRNNKGRIGPEVREGDAADLVVWGRDRGGWTTRTQIAEAVYLYDGAKGRKGILGARITEESSGGM